MDLDSIVAEWYLGLYPPEKMPLLAVWALDHGFDGKALRELAGLTSATWSNNRGMIESALLELGRPDAYQSAMSDESGHFAMRGMNPGSFQVLAFEEMRENYRLPAFAKKYEGKGQKVELEEGGKKSVTVKLITEEGKGP